MGVGATNLAIKDPQQVVAHLNLVRPDPWNYAKKRFYEWFRGKPGRQYFMHFDLAKGTTKDAAGVALSHREPTGVCVVDWMHCHRSRVPGQDIQFAELRQYVFDLHARGFAIKLVTYDQWQSIETRQILEGNGFKTDEVSADKTMTPYDTLIEMMLTDRLDYYNHSQFVREMQQLRTNGIKYDHPKNGTKDVSDAVACSVWKAIEDALENPQAAAGVIRVHRRRPTRPRPVYQAGRQENPWA